MEECSIYGYALEDYRHLYTPFCGLLFKVLRTKALMLAINAV